MNVKGVVNGDGEFQFLIGFSTTLAIGPEFADDYKVAFQFLIGFSTTF